MLQTTQLPCSVSVHSSSSSFCYAQHGACTLKEVAALDFEAIAMADNMQSCRADDLSQARVWMISLCTLEVIVAHHRRTDQPEQSHRQQISAGHACRSEKTSAGRLRDSRRHIQPAAPQLTTSSCCSCCRIAQSSSKSWRRL